ncbi:dihydrodipicolinate synthase family protein [Botrimarina hoheduenensis]|uniref:4-hydroxy-tetrahydrodipicolinate synthase n=1 Tax=Botrimarina hoheduenensis TaxID=2528000 RepID=A0A5C5VRF6_9BACT|nr:dihydrodipicolinate synthase family protein [Botrimarina hoheduenensis]TWT40760.1 hypothetical protein Pla111_31780 [Botrimarina hoheduenensis]
MEVDPLELIQPRRRITGITAVLLPYCSAGEVDWPAFESLLKRTVAAGLTPAVNMDTGYVNLLDDATRGAVLARTAAVLGGERFVAGAFVADCPGDAFDLAAYATQIDGIQATGGVPVIFQSFGLAHQPDEAILRGYQALAERCDEMIAFELGTMFAPFGRVYSLEVYRELMAIRRCTGAKHSSLRRDLEWQRLALRNRVRPDFRVYTGNDLAIDMVVYGSDYLLGLSCFAPDAFALRDAMWEAGDSGWNEVNDLLQHLGFLAFRDPVPAYKHSAAMFLKERGWIGDPATHPRSPKRGSADRELLAQIATRLELTLANQANHAGSNQ